MGHIFFLLLFLIIAVIGIVQPWIGVVCAYAVSVLTPQEIWYWDFWGIRPVFLVMFPTCLGALIFLVRGRFDLSMLGRSRNLYVFVLWACFVGSYYFGPFSHVAGGPDNRTIAFDDINKMMLLYFVGCLCIDSEAKARTLFYVVVGCIVYLIYWANLQYFSGQVSGRLAGPGAWLGGIYGDQNDFAMVLVVGQAFLWYLGSSFNKAILRWGAWLAIPFCWNAIFLTASRGGLLALGTTIVVMALRSKSKMLGVALILALFSAYHWEAGSLMKSRADTLGQYQKDGSAEDRLEAWRAAGRMIADHPITGVGLASFYVAFPRYSHWRPHEAHNTYLQIAAESGIVAGLVYLLLVISTVRSLWRIEGIGSEEMLLCSRKSVCVNEATLVALCGFAVCSIFLSLEQYDIFYCLLVFANSVRYTTRETLPKGGAKRVTTLDSVSAQPNGLA